MPAAKSASAAASHPAVATVSYAPLTGSLCLVRHHLQVPLNSLTSDVADCLTFHTPQGQQLI